MSAKLDELAIKDLPDALVALGRPGNAMLVYSVLGLTMAKLTPDIELQALGDTLARAGLKQLGVDP